MQRGEGLGGTERGGSKEKGGARRCREGRGYEVQRGKGAECTERGGAEGRS